MAQELGNIVTNVSHFLLTIISLMRTQEGKVLVFPNIYQHKVPKFTLKDKTRPGHRKILVFFLVDPTQHIVSTADVPIQSLEMREEILNSVLGQRLPPEICGIIARYSGFYMTLEEAKEYRKELMKERSYGMDYVTKEFFERPFDLCEH